MKTVLSNKRYVVDRSDIKADKTKMPFSNSEELLPGRAGHVEIPEPAAPAGPWPPSCLHGRSGPVDLCTIQKLLVILAGVLLKRVPLLTISCVNQHYSPKKATFETMEIQ